MALDKIDRKILALLQKDATTPVAEIGRIAARPPHTSNTPNANQRKPVSCVIAPPPRRLVC